MQTNVITWRIKYSCAENLSPIIQQYNSLLRFSYKRLLNAEGRLSESELNTLQKSMNNCEFMNSWFRTCAGREARTLFNSSKVNLIFGGRKLYLKRCKHKISHSEFIARRLHPLYSIGESNCKGNRIFRIVDSRTIMFRLNRQLHFNLNIELSKNKVKDINKLIELQNTCQLPITYYLSNEFIYISFDYNTIKQYKYNTIENRVMSIDMNPNSIGWAVVDWRSNSSYHVIQSGTYSLISLNNKHEKSLHDDNSYYYNKLRFETIKLAKSLFELAKYYHCEIFAIENIHIVTKQHNKGKRYNRLINNMWSRNLLVQSIKKHIYASPTTLVEVEPAWSSYLGNVLYRKEKLPDECLSSIEISRRGYEFATQYVFNRRLHTKVIVFPELNQVKNQLIQSLEELNIDVPCFDTWKDILLAIKKSKAKYRFSSSEARLAHSERLFSIFYKQRYLLSYQYL